MKDIPKLYEKQAECCGCYACFSVCPKGAIKMKEDDEGFIYPHIDSDRCIICRQCITVCPIKKKHISK